MGKVLPLASMEKLLRLAGAERVSEDAKEALRDALERHSQFIGKEAVRFAGHAGRKTIKAEDVNLAVK